MRRFSIGVFAGAVASVMAVSAAESATETVLYSFQDNGMDGINPSSALTNVKGTLYGVTVIGGTYNVGTVYSVNAATGAETVLHSFGENSGDGAKPAAVLIKVSGALYGETSEGGTSDEGTVFQIDPSTGAEIVLYAFKSHPDGNLPFGGLIDVNGALYGTTSSGGEYDPDGTVFSINLSTKTETVLHSFKGPPDDGSLPTSGLINVNGTLYGTTNTGGAYNKGTVFSIEPSTGAETVVYTFCSKESCLDGIYPDDGLINVKGKLYGTTNGGGAYGQGTVFKINPTTRAERALYSFHGGDDGSRPNDAVLNVGSTLYGTTNGGGQYSWGTVFSLDRITGTETVLHSFAGSPDGALPFDGVINVNGTLYGVTAAGGSNVDSNYPIGTGTVFKINP